LYFKVSLEVLYSDGGGLPLPTNKTICVGSFLYFSTIASNSGTSCVVKFYLVEPVFQPGLSHRQLQLKYQDEKF
jgi:hypothetical protein